jgi:hypothetical protein
VVQFYVCFHMFKGTPRWLIMKAWTIYCISLIMSRTFQKPNDQTQVIGKWHLACINWLLWTKPNLWLEVLGSFPFLDDNFCLAILGFHLCLHYWKLATNSIVVILAMSVNGATSHNLKHMN